MKTLLSSRAENLREKTSPPVLISACLVGLRCRYDGGHSLCRDLLDFFSVIHFIPFCPEQLGGLPTPRPPADIHDGDGYDVLSGTARLLNAAGADVTDAFKRGAEESYALARLSRSPFAIMKSRSPSCGLTTPYYGTPAGMGAGVTAAFFKSNGIGIFELDRTDLFPCRHFFELFEKSMT